MKNEIDQATQDKITPQHIASAIKKESKWLLNAGNLTSTLDYSSCISWTAYHSSVQQASVNPASITAMLPLFFKKEDSSMVRHGINLWRKITEFLNPAHTHNCM